MTLDHMVEHTFMDCGYRYTLYEDTSIWDPGLVNTHNEEMSTQDPGLVGGQLVLMDWLISWYIQDTRWYLRE